MPRLLFVVNDPAFFLSHRRPVAEGARRAGFEVHVAAPQGPGWADLAPAGYVPHAFPLDRGSLDPRDGLGTVSALTRLYRAVAPALVHHVALKSIVFGGIAARRARVPAVVNAVTGLGWTFIDPGLKARATRLAFRAACRVALGHRNMRTVFQNQDDRDLFVRLGLLDGTRAGVIRGSGVDTARFAVMPPPTAEPPLVVLPARMLYDKGVGTFVEAARLLRARGIAARFVLAGRLDPQNRSGVPEGVLHGWEAEGVVSWWGHRSDILDVYRQAHIVCLPSRREGVPLALLEAASCGRPIVATDAPGCRDAVVPDESGLLVPVDDPGALAEALAVLIADPGSRDRMGLAGRAHVEANFSADQVVRATLALYGELLAR